jgi:arylsulfatase A-like enzyme
MNTRVNSFLHTALLFAPLVVLHAAEAPKTPPKKPNIVVFLADDMPWHYPGFNGGPCETPNLDRLAKEGTRLTRFYVHSVCSPTRAALLTGRYPFRNGMEERSHGNDTAGMLPDERTLAQALKPAGYDTALIGKWHLGNWYQRQLPLQRGFDHHYGLYGALVSYNGKTRGSFYDWHRDGETIREDGYTTDLLARDFERLMAARNSNRPFFYYVAFNAMHSPYDAPPALVEKYRKRAGTAPGAEKAASPQELATLESMDTAIGKMIAAMKAKGVLDNTLIVFFNDNGGTENPPFRGGKASTYEGGLRVPCIIHWPGHVPADKTLDGMVHVTDLYPTLLKLAGGSLEQPLPLDGMDMWEVFTGRKPSPRTEVVHNLPNGGTGEMGEMSICQGPWKLVGKELYDLSNDPGEKTDLAAKHPDIYQKLNARTQQLVAERRPPEKHLNIPDKPLLVLGEQENAHPPAWLQPYLDSLPGASKSKTIPGTPSPSSARE